MSAIVPGRKRLPPEPGCRYKALVDMSGGSNDEAVLGIAYREGDGPKGGRSVLALLISQTGKPPFNPRKAVAKFADALKEYGLSKVTGDAYAGETFRAD